MNECYSNISPPYSSSLRLLAENSDLLTARLLLPPLLTAGWGLSCSRAAREAALSCRRPSLLPLLALCTYTQSGTIVYACPDLIFNIYFKGFK